MDDFVIKYKDLRDISQEFKTNLNCLISDLESLESSINNFIDLDKGHYDGEGADAAKSYFQDVHITMVNGLKNAAQSLIDEMAIYKSGFYDIDPGTNFVISKEVILEFQEKLLSYAQQVYTDDGNELSPENTIKKELSSISDIYDGSYPSETAEEIISCHEELNTTMTNLIEKTETLEENIILGLEANTDSLISQIDGMNSVIGVDWQGMKDYSANSIFSNPTMTSLCTYSEQVESMHVLNEEMLDGIWENEAELIEKAEERVDQGYEKVFTGCIEMGSGVISIFGTGGIAIPFGITEVAIGYSDFTEGIDDICYGSEGDITTTSTNYAKSVVYYFGGNDETYYAVRDVVMFAGAAANPIAGQLQAGTCTIKTIVSAVTKEVVSTGAGEVTSQITYNITKDENLSMLAGMASSYGTSKGLGTIESKFTKSSSMTSGKIKDTTSELIEGCDDINSTKIQSEGPYANVEAQKTTQGPLIDDDVIGGNKVGNVEGPYKSGLNSADDIIRDGSQLENGKLKPNVKYQTGEHEYIYQTNEDGLISHASTDNLQIKTHEGRLNHNSNTYGKEVGDHAGHIFGDRFGGSPELDNLVSQAQRVNQSEFKIIENEWAKALENGQKVTVDIDINYASSSSRPTSFDVSYTIDDIPFFKHIEN